MFVVAGKRYQLCQWVWLSLLGQLMVIRFRALTYFNNNIHREPFVLNSSASLS